MKYLKRILLCLSLFIPIIILSSFTKVNAKELNNEVSVQDASDDSWKMILENIDIDIEYLEPDKYLGLYWDSFVGGSSKDGYLYLCWTSKYYTNTSNTILQF